MLDINSVYLQYAENGVTYTLVDPDKGLIAAGAVKEPVKALAGYAENATIPATVYRHGEDWLCTACWQYEDGWEGALEVVGQVGVDIDMNDVARERHWFLVNSTVFVAILTALAVATTMLLTWRMATKPLKLLAKGTTGFARGDELLSKEDIIRLPICSDDEIGDPYREIRSMQTRIVDNADRLMRITADKERVRTELAMAAQIQRSVLPVRFPHRPEFELYACMNSANEVGGDFYDFFMIDDDHLGLVIADVSDKCYMDCPFPGMVHISGVHPSGSIL